MPSVNFVTSCSCCYPRAIAAVNLRYVTEINQNIERFFKFSFQLSGIEVCDFVIRRVGASESCFLSSLTKKKNNFIEASVCFVPFEYQQNRRIKKQIKSP